MESPTNRKCKFTAQGGAQLCPTRLANAGESDRSKCPQKPSRRAGRTECGRWRPVIGQLNPRPGCRSCLSPCRWALRRRTREAGTRGRTSRGGCPEVPWSRSQKLDGQREPIGMRGLSGVTGSHPDGSPRGAGRVTQLREDPESPVRFFMLKAKTLQDLLLWDGYTRAKSGQLHMGAALI